MSGIAPKWKFHEAVSNGYKAINVVTTYQEQIIDRLAPGEFDTLKSYLIQLDDKGVGQTQALNTQKVETSNVGAKTDAVYNGVSAVRKLVAKVTRDKEIRTAFGIGTKISQNSVKDIKAAVNMVAEGYKRFTQWANNAGILEKDITGLQTLATQLKDAKESQEEAKTGRTVATVNKDLIQRKVEEIVTKISGIGVLAFFNTNPELVPLFESLIPGSGGSDDDSGNVPENEPAGVSSQK